MADYRGGWSLEITNVDDRDKNLKMSQCDLDHIADCIKRGFISGEIVKDDDEEE